MDHSWEDFVSINSQAEFEPRSLGSVSDYLSLDDGTVTWDEKLVPRDRAIKADTSPLPYADDREGYYGENHFNYWASGARDIAQILAYANKHDVQLDSVLDFGCASGRLLRHFHHSDRFTRVLGCDINRLHVDWCAHYLPKEIVAFQGTSVPTLPLEDNSISLITAFSVLTHIEAFEDNWLMEFRRILKPGGIAWLTMHTDRTWREIDESWPLYQAIKDFPSFAERTETSRVPKDRIVYRWHNDASYSSNVFYSDEYIKRRFGQILNVRDMFPAEPRFQEMVVFQKPR